MRVDEERNGMRISITPESVQELDAMKALYPHCSPWAKVNIVAPIEVAGSDFCLWIDSVVNSVYDYIRLDANNRKPV